MLKPIDNLDVSELLQRLLQLQVTVKKFNERKYFSLSTFIEKNFYLTSNKINHHKIVYFIVDNETIVTYLCVNHETIETDIQKITAFSELLKTVITRNDIFLLCTEVFHCQGKYQNMILFQQPNIAEDIIFRLKQLQKKTV